jgi:hypothetical protein
MIRGRLVLLQFLGVFSLKREESGVVFHSNTFSAKGVTAKDVLRLSEWV